VRGVARVSLAPALVAVALAARTAQAEPKAPPPVSGVERPAEEPADPARTALTALLYLPRQTVDLLFVASGSAAGMIQDEQFVPRVAELVDPGPGRIGVFPTAFAETGKPANVGARMIANLGSAATSLRAGYGGPDDVVVAGRIRLSRATPLASNLSIEGSYDRRSDRDYLGVGQDPASDPRNRFASPEGAREALFLERRVRTVTGLGIRPSDDVELFLSTSLTLRRVEDSPDAGPAALSRVFAPGSVPGAFEDARLLYGELALRLDTRASRGRPSPGVLVETYFGAARGVLGDESVFSRIGGRAAWFLPVLKRANILSPKLVLDGVKPFGGLPVSFAELARQPDFRGFDDRRDNVSLVGSLDYRWSFVRYVAARVFFDVATVAPRLPELDLGALRYAAGLGVDVSSNSTELGRVAMSASPDGVRLMLSFGVPTPFGDRQHRD
jgi:hypothetical protein